MTQPADYFGENVVAGIGAAAVAYVRWAGMVHPRDWESHAEESAHQDVQRHALVVRHRELMDRSDMGCHKACPCPFEAHPLEVHPSEARPLEDSRAMDRQVDHRMVRRIVEAIAAGRMMVVVVRHIQGIRGRFEEQESHSCHKGPGMGIPEVDIEAEVVRIHEHLAEGCKQDCSPALDVERAEVDRRS